MAPKFVLVNDDCWEGLYKDGALVAQGHRIEMETLAVAAGLDFELKFADSEATAETGWLPDNLDEVKFNE